MADPLVSVVIPTYKRPALLETAIGSVLAQTYRNWELIVVDDNDEDSSYREATERFMTRYAGEPRIRYVKHKRNSGLPTARNTGIRQATGRYVAFLDDDDLWLPTKLEKQVACFEKAGDNVALVYTGLRIVDAASGSEQDKLPKARTAFLRDLFSESYIGTPSSVMCRKDALDGVGLFDESLPSAEDWDLYVRLAKNFAFDFVAEPLAVYNKHEGERMLKNFKNVTAAYARLYEKYKPSLEQDRRLHALFLKKQGRLLFQAGETRAAQEKLTRSLLLNPLNRRTIKLLLQVRWNGGRRQF